MANLHTPERQSDESQQQYRERRAASHRAVAMIVRGELVKQHIGHNRRQRVKAAGGIRQFKRQRYAKDYPGYAERHPAIKG